jgi:coenzyme F420 hydrogenase subunit beta
VREGGAPGLLDAPGPGPWWARLRADVLDPGLCTQCGTCVGLSQGGLEFRDRDGVPRPVATGRGPALPRAAYEGCPARWCHYPELNRFVFGKLPASWLAGVVERSYVGHAADESVRRAGASGGVISAVLLHLLDTGRIAGAVCLELGRTVPYPRTRSWRGRAPTCSAARRASTASPR